MHRVKMARIDNPMPLWSIPYVHNTHTRVERIDTRVRPALFFADRARAERECNATGNKDGGDGTYRVAPRRGG